MNYRISNIAVDTKNAPNSEITAYIHKHEKLSSYLLTAIGYNNDFYVNSWLRKDQRLITIVESLSECQELIRAHLSYFGRKEIDILAVPGDIETEERIQLKSLVEDHPEILDFALINPGIEILKTFSDSWIKPEYVLIDLNPYNFDLDLIKYCQNNSIKIIAKNIYGINSDLTKAWTAEFLTGFASYWADIVCIPSNDLLENFTRNLNYAGQFIGNECYSELYDKSESVSLDTSDTKSDQIIHRYYKAGEDYILIGGPEDFLDQTEHRLEISDRSEYIEEKKQLTVIEDLVHTALMNLEVSFRNTSEFQAYIRYLVVGIIRDTISKVNSGLRIKIQRQGDFYILRVYHKWFWWIHGSFGISAKVINGEYRVYFSEYTKKESSKQ